MSRRVVVTGLGATTPLGGDVATTWRALLAGQSGVKRIEAEWASSLPVSIAAPVAVDPSEVMDRIALRKLDRSEAFALIAAREAFADAGSPTLAPLRTAVAIASGIGGVSTLIEQYDIWRTKGASPEFQTNMGRRSIGHQHRNRMRTYMTRALSSPYVILLDKS